MDKFFNKTKEFIFAKQTSIVSSTLILALMVITARLFGFLRYRVLAGYFTKEELDIYFAAFRIPDLIFEILITGALTTSFIPFFIKYQEDKKTQSAHISTIINIIIIALFFFIIGMVLIMPYIMGILTPGFSKEKTEQIASFSQILLLGQLPFLVIGNFLTGISQARKSFLVPAIAPVLYNLAIIVVTFFFSNQLSLLAPVVGVIVGSILFLIIQVPIIIYANFEYKLVIKWSKELIEFFRMIIPRMFTVIVSQIDATIDLTLATLLGSGAYTIFYFAQHLQLLPVSVIGIAFGQASLPYLSEIYQKKDTSNFKKVIVDSILNLFFFMIPIMAYFIIARTPMVRLFYGGEKFDWDATVQTAYALSYFSISLPFHAIYYFLTRCFYAMFDSKTPFYTSLFSIVINALLSVFFIVVLKLPVQSLAISFSVSIIVNVVILLVILYIRLKGLDMRLLLVETLKMSVSTLICSFFIFYLQKLLDGWIFDTTRTINIFFLLLTTTVAYFLLYLFLSWVFNVKEMYLITKMLLKVREYQRKISEVYTGVQ